MKTPETDKQISCPVTKRKLQHVSDTTASDSLSRKVQIVSKSPAFPLQQDVILSRLENSRWM